MINRTHLHGVTSNRIFSFLVILSSSLLHLLFLSPFTFSYSKKFSHFIEKSSFWLWISLRFLIDTHSVAFILPIWFETSLLKSGIITFLSSLFCVNPYWIKTLFALLPSRVIRQGHISDLAIFSQSSFLE